MVRVLAIWLALCSVAFATCPCSVRVEGTVYNPDGQSDANDTVSIVSFVNHSVTLGGCTVQPIAPVQTATNANGELNPVRLPCGLPVMVTLGNGLRGPIQTFVPYGVTAINLQDMFGMPGTTGPNIGVAGVRLDAVTLAQLGLPTNGTMKFCSDCQTTTPCTGGSTGALAVGLAGVWNCQP